MEPDSMALTKSSSVSNVRARPVKPRPSLPVIFATAPPGARLPFKILFGVRFNRAQTGKQRYGTDISGDAVAVIEQGKDILACRKFCVFVCPLFEICSQSEACAGHIITVD